MVYQDKKMNEFHEKLNQKIQEDKEVPLGVMTFSQTFSNSNNSNYNNNSGGTDKKSEEFFTYSNSNNNSFGKY